MAVVDVTHKTITLKVVYYGCALGGKTTNLQTLHKLTDPDAQQGLLSIATKDDRTLFFDLLPMDLGQIGGLAVHVKIYTVPGQVHYELTRRQVLSGTDGVVFVADSHPDQRKANQWALENLRYNLSANGLDPEETPLILQWNKRDLPEACEVSEMEAALNPKRRKSLQAVATTGLGVVETFAAVLKAGLERAYGRSRHSSMSAGAIVETVDRALADARSRVSASTSGAPGTTFDHRVDMEAYREEWAAKGRDRKIMDHETLLAESVKASMEMAERLDGLKKTQAVNERRSKMMKALSTMAGPLADPGGEAIPPDLLVGLLAGGGRRHGSILLFKSGEIVMEERCVVPDGPDALNHATAPGVGSPAFNLSRTSTPQWVEDLASQVFFNAVPPGAEQLASAFIAPLACDGLSFGALVVYARVDEEPLDPVEREYWSAASKFLSLSLHWRALRQKVQRSAAQAG